MTRNIKPAVHGSFYRWAAEFVQDKKVLDVGCGDGIGDLILAEFASEVTAIDTDAALIRQLQDSTRFGNIEFRIMDGQDPTFHPGSFDVVVSCALLEYLPEPDKFFGAAQSLLRPKGVILCATKNFDISLKRDESAPLYRNHLQEFNAESLRNALGERFLEVKIVGETMSPRAESYIMDKKALRVEAGLVRFGLKSFIPAGLRRTLRQRLTGVELAELDWQDFPIGEEDYRKAYYLVGSGQKAE